MYSRKSPQQSSQASLSSLDITEDLFNYTRGRFIADEANELAQRYVRFNVHELARLSAEAVGARFCVSVKKFPDGMYNKAILLTMDNGSQVVAKVPNPNAGQAHFTTASEVATMDFARNENPVGAEYIIMEKVQGIELEEPTREKKLKALNCYLELIKYMLPPNESISTSHLWHGDLHVANIFVNPKEPTEIVGLIDWQSTELSPLYYLARRTYIIDHDGPPVDGLTLPQLPPDMESLSPDEQILARALYYKQVLCQLYKTIMAKQNPRTYAALEFQKTTSFSVLLLARSLLIDGEALYLMQTMDLEKKWSSLPGVGDAPYPFSFSAKEREEIRADAERAVLGMQLMSSVKSSIGELFPEKGVVRFDLYDESLNALDQIKDQVPEELGYNEEETEIWRKEWPFGT
ncbi:hypothetical protein MMC25_004356 [Agyrium rufum]|nr:hypothetical protein [Agyrium rufum]